MFHAPNHSLEVSLKLSEVLSDIGMNGEMVLKTRRMVLLQETLRNTAEILIGSNKSIYIFGSQSESTTTRGLTSDQDYVFSYNNFNVIQDWSEWQPGKVNLLMTQDETTSPGYCLLQDLRYDEPSTCLCFCEVHGSDKDVVTDGTGRKFVKIRQLFFSCKKDHVMNGPAHSWEDTRGNMIDYVNAFQCKSWPKEAQPWFIRQGIGGWPTEEMKRYCETTGCLVVPVSNKSGQNQELEWRISTSMAERCLMFNLNITQLRCYILMKMILKTYINKECNGVLSSYMCKTVLFYSIQNTHSNQWQEHNLLACLKCCLIRLQNCVRQENCPHFIIPENNLMDGRISSPVRERLLALLEHTIQCEVWALVDIPIDDLGQRLQEKMIMLPVRPGIHYKHSSAEIAAWESAGFLYDVSNCVYYTYTHILNSKAIKHARNEMVPFLLLDLISRLTKIDSKAESNTLVKAGCRLLSPLYCSSLGSVVASADICGGNSISAASLNWFSAGFNSDVSSGRLKFASALYCVGDMESAEFVLRSTQEKYDLDVVQLVCECNTVGQIYYKLGFLNKCKTGNEELVKDAAALCVTFMQHEINCIPKELQYEMFRSTLVRDEEKRYWMDWAVVDSLPYIYFLQYKTSRNLQRAADQQRALSNLVTTIDTERNLGHRETALNLLGQCMEQENRYNAALHCYMRSLKIRAKNNTASIHICRLLSALSLKE